MTKETSDVPLPLFIACVLELGTLRCDNEDGNENVEKAIGFIRKNQQLCKCITLVCTFLCPFLHDYDLKMPLISRTQLPEVSPTFDEVSG